MSCVLAMLSRCLAARGFSISPCSRRLREGEAMASGLLLPVARPGLLVGCFYKGGSSSLKGEKGIKS